MLAKRSMLVAGCAFAVAVAPAIGFAQTVAKPPAGAERPASANGLKAYEAGTKAFEAGKYAPAIQALSAALSAGGLSSQQMAKALYYRGVAYRKTGKSALAISDLTSSVWLKNGLNDADRAAAMDQRQGAYREAGLGAGPAIGDAPLDAPAAAPAPAVPAPAVAAAPTESATSSWAVTTGAGAAQASIPNLSAPVSPPPPAATVPAGGFATIGASEPNPPTLAALPQSETTPPSAAPAPLSGVGTAIGDAGSAVGNFFGGLFGGAGGSGATTTASDPVATAATEAPPAAARPAPATTGWNAGTSVVEGKPKKVAAAADKPRATPAGKYLLQVGVLRSRAEAEQLASNLRAQHGAALGSVAPAIDEVVYGNMGTFYRVQVGPYASAAEPGDFCSALKPQGYDCLVITQ
jgi:tetratricopeptide (TPR) repeat protein